MASFERQGAAKGGVYRILRAGATHLYGYEVGPTIPGASRTDQRLCILFGVGQHYEENEVELA